MSRPFGKAFSSTHCDMFENVPEENVFVSCFDIKAGLAIRFCTNFSAQILIRMGEKLSIV